jgi:hypothetical protein
MIQKNDKTPKCQRQNPFVLKFFFQNQEDARKLKEKMETTKREVNIMKMSKIMKIKT